MSEPPAMNRAAWLDELDRQLGEGGVLRPDRPSDQSELERYCREWRGRYVSTPLAVARPASTDDVVAVVQACQRARVAMVPQGGNTGLMGGAVANGDAEQLIISLDRMRRIVEVNAADACLVAEAGVTLADANAAAAEQGLRVPIDLASAGSASLGGLVASNAGGLLTLRFGTTRAQVLGLEVVLADGQVWSGLRSLRKDNAGYDLKHCFIGSEGTLGIVTTVALALKPVAAEEVVAWVAVDTVDQAVALLNRLRAALGEQLSVCELMPSFGVGLACAHLGHVRCPVDVHSPWHVLVQLDSARRDGSLESGLIAVLSELEASQGLKDAVLATSIEQAHQFWRLREAMSDAQRAAGLSIKHDVAVPISQLAAFVSQALAAVELACPGIRPCVFGHLGDGSLHFNLSRPEAMSDAEFAQLEPALNALVFDQVQACRGSIAAEHGVGQLRAAELEQRLDPVHWRLMKTLKQALDPNGLLNPGKVL
jgi:D-lactate dehydrogenase (cytochrome)